ncbi:hypothetical protein RFI_07832 [Reticulomyxa filosa]|uniref:Uncharacterized protein n=1 Tax=Reticulomyxa filosa TaxID=46433 RepID=X6NTL3_RETFI|nr:hypothetical protein RFI_07832 [Reticulomyxa filosa]|eukprot:ETO29293.1 hypothetical protein RFI_07832 [Reticulomyxa filosa]
MQAQLSYYNKAIIAYRLTHCHLLQSGIKINPCKNQKNHENLEVDMFHFFKCQVYLKLFALCHKKLVQDFRAFSTYNNFFTYVDDICLHHVLHTNHDMIGKTIQQLHSATTDISKYLEKIEDQYLQLRGQFGSQHKEWVELCQRHLKELQVLHALSEQHIKKQNAVLGNQLNLIGQNKHANYVASQFRRWQNNLIWSHLNMTISIETILKEQTAAHESMGNLIKLQQQSHQTGKKILNQQMETLTNIEKNQQTIKSNFEETQQNQLHLLEKQQKTVDEMNKIYKKADTLKKMNEKMHDDFDQISETQLHSLKQINVFIEKIYHISKESYHSVMTKTKEILSVVNSIYELDIYAFQQNISLNCTLFYLICIVSTPLNIFKTCSCYFFALFE